MTEEESILVVFDDTNPAEQGSLRNCAEEDEQNIFLKNLETCPKNQSIDPQNQ